MRKVLMPYRGWPEPDDGSRWALWVNAVEQHESVKATTSSDELYLDSYERYAGESLGFVLLWGNAMYFFYWSTEISTGPGWFLSTKRSPYLSPPYSPLPHLLAFLSNVNCLLADQL